MPEMLLQNLWKTIHTLYIVCVCVCVWPTGKCGCDLFNYGAVKLQSKFLKHLLGSPGGQNLA